jgi:YidC/Oxa1 family membrane protein insertase
VKKKIGVIVSLLFLVSLLSGCTEVNEPITSDSEGIWNTIFVYPLSWLIIQIASWFPGTWGYGFSIIIITILIRTLILPLMIKQTQSSKKMQLIQPELEKLKNKYSSKDAMTQKKFQEEQMLLFQRYDISPLAGCLPLLVQMPILIAFYHAIMRTEAIKGHSFLWFELAERDPYFILPILAAVLTFVQQKVMTKGQPANPQLAVMLYTMPVMIAIFSMIVPAALPLYWVVGNIYTIVQTHFIKTPELEGLTTATSAGSGRPGGKKK